MPLEIPLKAFFYSGRNNGVSETWHNRTEQTCTQIACRSVTQ
jgi:hypothetical protein